uniref:hypothetical protein n=1 Tax=Candidatus Enterococcus willemsii TaxID=1857215 RepID=UPI00403F2746
MEESIFFNKGNIITASVDVKDLYETVQIRKNQRTDEKFIIVKNPNEFEYILFGKKDFEQLPNREEYQVVEYLS